MFLVFDADSLMLCSSARSAGESLSHFLKAFIYEEYSEVTSGEHLTKQAMRKMFYMQKEMHTFKLLPKIVIAGMKALVSRKKFLYDCVKEEFLL